jgi:hypothetical protein
MGYSWSYLARRIGHLILIPAHLGHGRPGPGGLQVRAEVASEAVPGGVTREERAQEARFQQGPAHGSAGISAALHPPQDTRAPHRTEPPAESDSHLSSGFSSAVRPDAERKTSGPPDAENIFIGK